MAALSPKDYWSNKDIGPLRAAPNASLFRFLGSAGFDFADKAVLEIGFGHGADLLEAQRRGSRIHGVDINAVAVEQIRRRTGLDTFWQADIAKDPIEFGTTFDAIYSRDTIYYLDDHELAVYARRCFDALAPGGLVVVHFILGDWARREAPAVAAAAIDSGDWTLLDGSFASDNPIRFLDPVNVAAIFEAEGGRLIGRKTLSETYGIDEEFLRHQRYFMFSRRPEA